MKLYIGNATRQVHEFTYRVLEFPAPRSQTVPIGGQVLISGDLSSKDVDYIVDQHKKYGIVDANASSFLPGFSGICYSIDRPITTVRLARAMEKNMDQLQERGKQMRTELAVAVNSSMERQAAETGAPAPMALDMSAVEVEPSGGYPTDKPFGEGVLVTRDAPASGSPAPGRGRGRGRGRGH